MIHCFRMETASHDNISEHIPRDLIQISDVPATIEIIDLEYEATPTLTDITIELDYTSR